MFWNVCGGRLGWNGVLETIREEDPDVLVLAEIRFDVAYVDKELSNYPYHYKLPRAVRMYSRFPIGESKSHHRSWRGAFEQIEVLSPNGPFNLLVADLPSPPYYKRQEPIELLTEMGFDYLDKPAVIVGDMNTPVDSVFLERLRTEYSHAFETAGNGYHATWPMPLPVIAIDQMWINKLVKVSNCKVRWTVRSDHRPLIADLIVSSP